MNIQSQESDEIIIIEKTIVTQTKSLGKPPGKKLKSDQSSLFQHFKRTTQPKMTPPPPSADPTPQVLLFLYKITSYTLFFFFF